MCVSTRKQYNSESFLVNGHLNTNCESFFPYTVLLIFYEAVQVDDVIILYTVWHENLTVIKFYSLSKLLN